MRLAEALAERAQIKQKLNHLQQTAVSSTVEYDGNTPPDDANDLIREYLDLLNQYEQLIFAINATNNHTMTHTGLTLSEMVVRRDICKMEFQCLGAVTNAARRYADGHRGFGMTPTKAKALVDVRELQQRTDSAARALREWDNLIQQYNWTTELIDITMTEEDFED